MRILVTGTQGQVARALLDRAGRYPDLSVLAVGRPQLDLETTATVLPALERVHPDLIINAAAYTAVDKAEQEPLRAHAINRDGAAAVADAAWSLGVPLIHLSTDYVFPGTKQGAYVESDKTDPINVYGNSKLSGEVAVRSANAEALIFRTSWIYSPYGSNFVKTMLRLAAERPQLRVVDDQVGNPTSALDLADALLQIAPRIRDQGVLGETFHVAGSGTTSWCGVARQVFETSKLRGGPQAEVVPITTSEYPTPARRPANSRLDTTAFYDRFGFSLGDWHRGVEVTVQELLMRDP